MPRLGRIAVLSALAVVVLVLPASREAIKAAPASEPYETVLGPTPINHVTMTTLTGDGDVTAVLNGSNFKITGTFQGLPAAATDAHLMMGDGIGIPGPAIADLTVTAAVRGSLSGSLTLTRAQIAALHAGRLYVQINSPKGPAPDGNVWGWILPEHKKAGQDEPIMGDWYLPQGKGLKAGRGDRQS
jgi:hypothetical protein